MIQLVDKVINDINKKHKDAIINYQILPMDYTLIISLKTRDGRVRHKKLALLEVYRNAHPYKMIDAAVNEMLEG